jgi:hypothetical protein
VALLLSPILFYSMVSGHPLNLTPPLTRSCVCLITVFRVIASLPVPNQFSGLCGAFITDRIASIQS